MKLIFLGPPGAGKGTHAGGTAKRFGIPHISTGDMFRDAIKNETPVGLRAKSFIDRGELVPDSVTIDMVDERIHQDDCAGGYLLDGFPRTKAQAEALEAIEAPDYVVNLDVPEEMLMDRLTGRRVCEACRATHAVSRLENEHVCPDCGGKLIHRADDQPETIKGRLGVYKRDTQPLIDYYLNKGKLVTVDSVGELARIGADIVAALEAKS